LNHLRYPFKRPEPRPPVVLLGSVHTNDAWGYERPHLLRLTSKAYATVAHTEHERQWLLARGAPTDRVTVIPEGIDPEQPRARPGAFRAAHGLRADALLVAYVGQQGSHKGIEVLMDCWPRLLGECPSAWLIVAGSRTPYTEVLERQAAQLPPAARERFRLLHDLEPQAKADLLGDCDIFASPSGYESFGITTLEAWSQAKPVIVGDGPAQREVVEAGVAGLLVPYRDEGRLLEALLRLARRPELRRSLGDAGRARLRQRYTIDKVAAAYAELYERAHAGAGR
jgi:glycosyltransferase involved in cell wall biosynthesis